GVLEELNGQAMLLRELADARLAEEFQRRVAIEKQLEASRQELLLVKAEAESRRLEAQVHDARTRPTQEPAAAGSDSHQTFAALKDGVPALSSVRRDELLSSLLEQLSCHFVSTAVFAATPQGIRLVKGRAT